MKKNKILLFFAIFALILFIFSFFINLNGIIFKYFWFSTSIFLIGLYALLYCSLYKLDSSLYYGVLLVSLSFIIFVQMLYAINIYFYYPYYILCFALASFAVFVLFRQNIHFKLFAILTAEVILLIVYKMNKLNIWQLIAINGIYLTFVIVNSIFRLKKNLRRVK